MKLIVSTLAFVFFVAVPTVPSEGDRISWMIVYGSPEIVTAYHTCYPGDTYETTFPVEKQWGSEGGYQCPNGGMSGTYDFGYLSAPGTSACFKYKPHVCHPKWGTLQSGPYIGHPEWKETARMEVEGFSIHEPMPTFEYCNSLGITQYIRPVPVKWSTDAECVEEEDPPPSDDPIELPPDPNGSPIIVDPLHNGFHLTSFEDGVRFDLDANGVAERIAWTAAGSDESFLALDRNGNGRIDNGAELFGNYTPPYLPNGFEALKVFDADNNGLIDKSDPVFSQLLLWTDTNHNGLSEPSELQPLSRSMLAIHLDYKTANRQDRYGNIFRQRAKAVWPKKEAYVYDVWLKLR